MGGCLSEEAMTTVCASKCFGDPQVQCEGFAILFEITPCTSMVQIQFGPRSLAVSGEGY